jgi:hypothetical protein
MDQAINTNNSTFLSTLKNKGVFHQFYPSKPVGKLFFCFFTPFLTFTALFLLIAFTAAPWGYIPYLSLLLSSSITLSYKKWGIVIASVFQAGSIFYLSSIVPLSLWTGGFFLSHVLLFLVLDLCMDEVSVVFDEIQQEVKARVKEYHSLAEQHQKEIAEREKKETTLKDEIKEWKEEAEHRALDYRALLEKVEIYEGDVSLLQSQKDELMDRAFSGEKIVKEHQERVESVKKMELELKSQLERIEKEKSVFRSEIESLNEQTQELLQAQEALKKRANPILAKMLCGYVQAIPQLEFQSPDERLRRECGKWEGLYRQLREQFEEKNQTLHLTRQELFQTKGELEAQQITLHNEKIEQTAQAYHEMQLVCNALEEELEESRSVITELEGLVSHILHG